MTNIKSCYCYDKKCNIMHDSVNGPKMTVVHAFWIEGMSVPKCPYCKKKMTITANIGINGDFE